MNPQFSIIIPHYNIPELLMRCLKSIPVTENIQVIVVDDNSPDADTYLGRFPELSRPFLEFISAPPSGNGAPGTARNIGMEYAKGEWLLFADADDFYVDNMYDLILSQQHSEADVIYFRKRAVYSDDIHRESKRDGYLDEIMDIYLKTGDEWPIRTKYYVPWGKMVRKSFIEKYHIRFDATKYSADVCFSTCVGYYAKKIGVVDTVLYVATSRPDSLITNWGSKLGEIRDRADVSFRNEKFKLRHCICRERNFKRYMVIMFRKDRKLFRYYFWKLDEIYPSKFFALYDISRGKSLKFKVKFFLYSLVVWLRH